MKNIFSILKNKVVATLIVMLFATGAFAQVNVLLCSGSGDPAWTAEVQNKLIATGNFASVSTFDITTGTPSLGYLQTFQAVLVWTDYMPLDGVALGDSLAAYIDLGGGVVSAVFENASVPIGGAFNTSAYQVVVPLDQSEGTQLLLGATLVSGHPIMDCITNFDAGTNSYQSTSTTLAPGAQFVANYNNGSWLVASKINVGPLNARRADLNFYPPSSDSRSDFWNAATQGTNLMSNALLWVSGLTSPGAITGSATICAGATTTYSITAVLNAQSYTWNLPAGTVINSGQGTTSINVTAGSTSGNITVTTVSACGSSDTSTLVLTVNPVPTVTAISTSASICVGNSVTLTGSGALSYAWSGGVIDAVAFAPTSTLTYTVTGTDANGCFNIANTTVTVNALPVVSLGSDTAICAGSITLDAGNAGAAYYWNDGSTNQLLTVSASGSYIVTDTLATGCYSSDTILVTINALPTVTGNASSSVACLDDASVVLTGMPSGGLWNGAGVTGSTFSPITAGIGAQTATYTFTDSLGCVGVASVNVQVNACTGLVDFSLVNGVTVFPNPNNGYFTLSVNANVGDLTIEMIDARGRVVFSTIENNVHAGFSKQISVDQVENGIYLLRLISGNEQKIEKVSIQK